MPKPTITFSPQAVRYTPGQMVNLNLIVSQQTNRGTVTSPAPQAGYYTFVGDSNTPTLMAAALAAAHANTLSFTAPTVPGNYPITATAYWSRVSGVTIAPSPGGGNITTSDGTQPGKVTTLESWANDAATVLIASLPVADFFANSAGAQANEGATLALVDTVSSSYYYLYLVTVAGGGSWLVQAKDVLNSIDTVRATSAALVNSDTISLYASNGTIEARVNGVAFFTWTVNSTFQLEYAGFVTGATANSIMPGGYPQPAITAGGIATTATEASFTLQVGQPAITGAPAAMLGGAQITLSNGGATGGTWTTTAGTITQAGVLTAPCESQTITVTYSQADPTAPSAEVTIAVNGPSDITISGNYTTAYVGGQIQFANATAGGTWSVSSGGTIQPQDSGTVLGGLFSATQPGAHAITYTTPNGCVVTYTLTVYESLTVAEAPDVDSCLTVQRNEVVPAFTVTGGSGSEIWTSDCGVSVDKVTGAFTAPSYAVECGITLTDLLTGQAVVIPICVQGPTGTCITPLEVVRAARLDLDSCAEFRVECGGSLLLSVPGIGLSSNVRRMRAAIPNWEQSVLTRITSPHSQLTSEAAGATALGNTFSAGEDFRLDVVVTPSMLSSKSETRWGFVDTARASAPLRWSVGVTADGRVGVWDGLSLMGDFGQAFVGQTVGIAFEDGEVTAYKGGIAIKTLSAANCGDLSLLAEFGAASVTLGGAASPAWTAKTAGNAALIGVIQQNGLFTAPTTAGLVELEAGVGDAANPWLWRVNVRVVQSTPRRVHPHAIWSGGGSELWLNVGYYSYSQLPVLALDGSPDAGNNPLAVDVGETTEGFKFKYEREQGEITTDSGNQIVTNGREAAMMSGEMVEVRDTEKLSALLSSATKRRLGGFDVLDFGGRNCICEFSAMLIKPNEYTCDSSDPLFDIIYMPRVVATTKGFEWSFKRGDITRLPFDLRVLPDKHRPSGAQLFSVYFSDGVDPNSGTLTTCKIS